MPVSETVARVKSTGKVTAVDILAARRAVYGNDGAIDPHEIEGLFAVDEAAREADPAWSMLLVEAGTDYIVHQQQPSGYVDEANADWLIARIGKDGVVKTATELELLVKVLEAAQSSPERLVKFALRQVQSAVVDEPGRSPMAANSIRAGSAAPRSISSAASSTPSVAKAALRSRDRRPRFCSTSTTGRSRPTTIRRGPTFSSRRSPIASWRRRAMSCRRATLP
jgi:hypothetical protein